MISTEDDRIPESVIERSPINYDDPYIAYDERAIGLVMVHSEIWRYTRWLPDVCMNLYMIILHDSLDAKRPRSITELAEAAGRSRSTVIEGIRALEYANMIQVRRDTKHHTMQKQNNGYCLLPAHSWKMLDRKYSAKENPASAASKSSESSRSKNWTSDSPKSGLKNNTIHNTIVDSLSYATLQRESQLCSHPLAISSPKGDEPVDHPFPKSGVTKEKTNGVPHPTATPLAALPTPAQQTLNIALQPLVDEAESSPFPPTLRKAIDSVQAIVPVVSRFGQSIADFATSFKFNALPTPPKKAPRAKKLDTGTAPTFSAKDKVWYRGGTDKAIPAYVLRQNKGGVVIARFDNGKPADKTVSPNTLVLRLSDTAEDTALLAYLENRETEYTLTARRGELMDAWAKAANGAYGVAGLNIAPLMRKNGGVFSQMAHLDLTPEQMRCAGELFRAWWEVQKPLVSQDVGATVNAIKQAVNMCGRGFKPDHVKTAMEALQRQPFWREKTISFDTLVTQIVALVPMTADGAPQKPHNPHDYVFFDGGYKGLRVDLEKLGYIGPDGKYCGPADYEPS